MKEKRIHWIDIARGFFIIAIVLGHVFNSRSLRNWLFSFHVPAFFFLSGYTFRCESYFSKFISKKINTIVIPYITFSLVSIFLFNIASLVMPGIKDIMECNVTNNILVLLYGNSKPDVMKYNSPLWFLPCLFSTTIFAYIVEILVNKINIKIRYTAMVFSIIVSFITNIYEGIVLPWHIETALSMLIWFLLGISARDYAKVHEIELSKVADNNVMPSLTLILIGGV